MLQADITWRTLFLCLDQLVVFGRVALRGLLGHNELHLLSEKGAFVKTEFCRVFLAIVVDRTDCRDFVSSFTIQNGVFSFEQSRTARAGG